MGYTPSARKIQAQNTKNRIYSAAKSLLTQKPVDDVTIEEISQLAGISVGAFYYYFKNKQEVIMHHSEELDAQYADYYYNVLCNPPCAQKPILEKLYLFIHKVNKIGTDCGVGYMQNLYAFSLASHKASNREFSESMRSPDRFFFKIMHEIVSKGQEAGEIRRDIPASQIVQDITTINRGGMVEWCMLGGKVDICQHLDHVISSYLSSIRAARRCGGP